MTNWILFGIGTFFLGCSMFLTRELISEYKIKKKYRNYADIKTGWVLLFAFLGLSMLTFYISFTVLSPQEQIYKDCQNNEKCIIECNEGYVGSDWGDGYVGCCPIGGGQCYWTNYRLKNDCELSPRDDKDCKCDEFKKYNVSYVCKKRSGSYGWKGELTLNGIRGISLNDCDLGGDIYGIFDNEEKNQCSKAHERSWQEVCDYKNMTYKKLLINNAKVSEYSGTEYEVCIS